MLALLLGTEEDVNTMLNKGKRPTKRKKKTESTNNHFITF